MINHITGLYPLLMRDKFIYVTLRLDYSFCPKVNTQILFDQYESILFRKGLFITKVEYRWKQNFFNWVMERFLGL